MPYLQWLSRRRCAICCEFILVAKTKEFEAQGQQTSKKN